MTARYRTFTRDERANRDAWITSRVENDCEDCYSDGELWRPAEQCPVHGADASVWWEDLNRELDSRWPGTWKDRAAAGEP